jgi:hypothetical protein
MKRVKTALLLSQVIVRASSSLLVRNLSFLIIPWTDCEYHVIISITDRTLGTGNIKGTIQFEEGTVILWPSSFQGATLSA